MAAFLKHKFHFMKKIFSLVYTLLYTSLLAAQSTASSDFFRNIGKIYVVVAVIALVFLGIVFFLIALERRLRKLEHQIKDNE